ncbi:hypothetical protein Scep_011301 [Stephania cephalantha]|uniref:CASP-like protein n=1 Tax=Stephania cephalantha TaxID=152367 RepID=A0AAP0JD28_9MAGN
MVKIITKTVFTVLLRLLALGASLAATIVTVTNHQTIYILNFSFDAKYSYAPAFVFYMIANAIVAGYSLVVLFIPKGCKLWSLILALDVVMAMLLSSSISAAGAIGYVAKKGNSHIGWVAICEQFSKFCNHGTGAIAAGVFGAIIYLVIVLKSIHAIITYDPQIL